MAALPVRRKLWTYEQLRSWRAGGTRAFATRANTRPLSTFVTWRAFFVCTRPCRNSTRAGHAPAIARKCTLKRGFADPYPLHCLRERDLRCLGWGDLRGVLCSE